MESGWLCSGKGLLRSATPRNDIAELGPAQEGRSNELIDQFGTGETMLALHPGTPVYVAKQSI